MLSGMKIPVPRPQISRPGCEYSSACTKLASQAVFFEPVYSFLYAETAWLPSSAVSEMYSAPFPLSLTHQPPVQSS